MNRIIVNGSMEELERHAQGQIEDDLNGDQHYPKKVKVNSRGQVRPQIYNSYDQSDSFMPPAKRKRACHPSENNQSLEKDLDDIQTEEYHVVNTSGQTIFALANETGQHYQGCSGPPEETECSEHITETNADKTSSDNTANDRPIYEGHTMTIFTSMILVWVYAMTHSITGSQLSDLLVLLNTHCLTNIPEYASIQTFKKFFENLKSPLVKHFYCSNCLMSVSSDLNVCPNLFCSKNLQLDAGKSYFVEFPIKQQLRELYLRPSFCNELKYKFDRKKERNNGIEDIYDGNIYKSLSESGCPLSDPTNISLTWNTDGVPVFKSSKVSIWPMYLMINELPYKHRIKKSNMLFYGLWFGESKPSINLFCGPLQDSLNELETEGIDITMGNVKRNIKVFLICGTADLPARSTCLNMTQFNGAFSCSRCLQKGQTEKIGQRGHTHIFPFKAENIVGPPRTPKDSQSDAVLAIQQSKPVNGIKGPTFLMGLQCYDLGLSTAVDYMHCVLLGVTKKLMTLWFSVSSASQPYSLVKQLEEVDRRLLKIKPTYSISRRPRSITDHFKFWKASELRSWLFFYSVPVLSDIMSPVYFYHYCAFVQGIWILCQDSVLKEEINFSYILLSYFVSMMEPLYGARYCTLNTHSLLHLPRCVQDLGPLWVYSCFPFESLNGELLKLFHGTQSIELQIISSINSHQILPGLIDKLPQQVKNIPILKKYIHKCRTAIGLKIDHNVYVVGGKKRKKMNNLEKRAFESVLGFHPVSLTFYDRMMLRNLLLHSENYVRVQARNSYTVMFLGGKNDSNFGHIKYFAVHRQSNCNCAEICLCKNDIFVYLKVLEKISECAIDTQHVDYPDFLNVRINHIHKLKHDGKHIVIDIQKIVSLCIDVSYSDGFYYVCEFPNTIECD